jgi:hypothetical protein
MAVRSRCLQSKWADKKRSVRKISVKQTRAPKKSLAKNQSLAQVQRESATRGFAYAAVGRPYARSRPIQQVVQRCPPDVQYVGRPSPGG